MRFSLSVLNFLKIKCRVVIFTIAIIFSFVPGNISWAASLPQPVTPAGYHISQSTGSSMPTALAFIQVPQDMGLQQAIGQISNGGIIELANGTYSAPAPEGFEIKNIGKSFTIQAAAGATVILDGNGANPIVSFLNTDITAGGPVTFKGLIFANGHSTMNVWAGGVTMLKAKATFENCAFKDNFGDQPNDNGGGGILVAEGSQATFTNCVWEGNTARDGGGGLSINTGSQVSVNNSTFINNRTNITNHSQIARGGGIFAGDSSLTIINSRFENNQTGYAGGGIYIIGNWADLVSTPESVLIVSNSVFSNNQSIRDSSVPCSNCPPTEGGAIHIEDRTNAKISDSYFLNNSSRTGGGVNLYRAKVEISNSVFKENKATGGISQGFGAAISAISNDTSIDGLNRRSAQLNVTNTLIQGIAGQKVSETAGGIYAAGDSNRQYGQNGVSQIDNVANNRAKIIINNVIFDNLRVEEISGVGGTGVGAGIVLDLAELTMGESMILKADAVGSANSSGGGMAILNQSLALLDNIAIARSTVEKFGAGLFIQGSQAQITNCQLIENELSPGVSEPVNESFGSVIFTMPVDSRLIPVNGKIENCTVSNNVGVPFFEFDRTNGPINDFRYNGNQIYLASASDPVFINDIAGNKTISQLNSLTITRANGQNTEKSQVDNVSLTTQPSVGALLAVPLSFTEITSAAIQASNTYTYYLGYAWSGTTATLDGVPLAGKAGVIEKTTAQSQVHTLIVDGQVFTQTVDVKVVVLDKQTYLPVILRN